MSVGEAWVHTHTKKGSLNLIGGNLRHWNLWFLATKKTRKRCEDVLEPPPKNNNNWRLSMKGVEA